MIKERQTDNQRKHTPRDDAYLAGSFFVGVGLAWGWAAESTAPIIVGLCVGVIVYVAIVIAQIRHEHRMAEMQAQGQIDVEKIEAGRRLLPPPTNVIDVTPKPPPQLPPNIMAPKLNPPMVQVPTGMRNSQRFVVPQVEPEVGDGVSLGDWPDDVDALKIALDLMCLVTPPTRKNFTAAGINSGSRYVKIRNWLVEAGLAKDFGDGNMTNWTSDAYNPDVQNAIRSYLNSPTAIAR